MAKNSTRSLVRHLKRGQTVRLIGVRGKVVKRPRPGRLYIAQIRSGKRTIGYVNPVKAKKPVPRAFTVSMLARLKSTRVQKLSGRPKSGKTYQLKSNDFIKNQISKQMIKEIRKNKGKAFNFRISHKNQNLMTHSIYFSGRMSEGSLKNLIVSDLLYTLSREHYRISPKPENIVDKKKIKRIESAQLTLQFTEIDKPKKKRGKNNGKAKKIKRKR